MQDVFDYVDDLKSDLSVKLPDTFYKLVVDRIEIVLLHFMKEYVDSVAKTYENQIEGEKTK